MSSCIFEGVSSSGQRYPLDVNCYAPLGEDRNLCDQRLSEESLALFQIAGGGADILWSSQDEPESRGKLETPKIQRAASQTWGSDLRKVFVASEDIDKPEVLSVSRGHKSMHVVFSIRPAFSWGHLAITEHGFRYILGSLQTFTPFLRVVHAFGSKINDKQRMRDITYYHMQPSFAFEFCYIIRYFELNGRQRGNPWSLRQTGVYQRCASNQCCTWILLNLSSYVNDRVAAAIRWTGPKDRPSQPSSPISVHIFIITAAIRNWSLYIEQLGKKVLEFEEKSYSSRVDVVYLDDYDLIFADVQAMVSLSETLDIVKAAIESQIGVISKCGDLHRDLRRKSSRQDNLDEVDALNLLSNDVQHHHKTIVAMAKTISRLIQLVSAILTSRSGSGLQGSINQIQMTVSEVQLQSRQTARDTSGLLQTTAQGHDDALKIKTMTQIATMFLPASLVASIFSSTIFSNSGNSTSNIGLYFAITVPLLFATLVFLIALEKDLPLTAFLRRLGVIT